MILSELPSVDSNPHPLFCCMIYLYNKIIRTKTIDMAGLKPIGSEKLEGMDKIRRIMEIARYNENLPQSVKENESLKIYQTKLKVSIPKCLDKQRFYSK